MKTAADLLRVMQRQAKGAVDVPTCQLATMTGPDTLTLGDGLNLSTDNLIFLESQSVGYCKKVSISKDKDGNLVDNSEYYKALEIGDTVAVIPCGGMYLVLGKVAE